MDRTHGVCKWKCLHCKQRLYVSASSAMSQDTDVLDLSADYSQCKRGRKSDDIDRINSTDSFCNRYSDLSCFAKILSCLQLTVLHMSIPFIPLGVFEVVCLYCRRGLSCSV